METVFVIDKIESLWKSVEKPEQFKMATRYSHMLINCWEDSFDIHNPKGFYILKTLYYIFELQREIAMDRMTLLRMKNEN